MFISSSSIKPNTSAATEKDHDTLSEELEKEFGEPVLQEPGAIYSGAVLNGRPTLQFTSDKAFWEVSWTGYDPVNDRDSFELRQIRDLRRVRDEVPCMYFYVHKEDVTFHNLHTLSFAHWNEGFCSVLNWLDEHRGTFKNKKVELEWDI